MTPIAIRRRPRQAGMTLVEMLLAITIFAIVSVSIGFILRTGFTTLDQINSKVNFNRRVIGSQKALEQILNGLIPVVTPCGGRPVGFQGSNTMMRFVSSYSLTEGSRGRPQIVELFTIKNDRGPGVRLLLNEYPYQGKRSLSVMCGLPPTATPNSFILADRLANCQFRFRRMETQLGIEMWLTEWIVPEWPSGISVDLAPVEVLANQIQPRPVFVPILVKDYNFESNL
jgi:prepilin-type N-terminal cleavage/methylation domain-containing protein